MLSSLAYKQINLEVVFQHTFLRFEASACHFPVGECARAHHEEEGASQGPVVMFKCASESWYPGEQHGWLIDVHHPYCITGFDIPVYDC